MHDQHTEQLITATCRRLSTKIGNDLQTVHDTLTAEIRRTLTSLAATLNEQNKSSSPLASQGQDTNSDKKE